MKYIRTKNGRIIDLDRVVYGYKVIHLKGNEIEGCYWAGWYWYSEEYGHEMECRDADIVKQANTIEELCDVFVLKDKNEIKVNESGEYKYRYATRYNGFRTLHQVLMEHTIYEDTEIYGAIWTDKGLIYVAKMNEKGELELL